MWYRGQEINVAPSLPWRRGNPSGDVPSLVVVSRNEAGQPVDEYVAADLYSWSGRVWISVTHGIFVILNPDQVSRWLPIYEPAYQSLVFVRGVAAAACTPARRA